MSAFVKYTKEQFIEAVASCFNIRQICIKIGITPRGANYQTVKDYIKIFNLDTSHFTPYSASGNQSSKKIPTEVYLNNEHPIMSTKLRMRLLKEGLLENRCYECGIVQWRGKPLSLELDHIDGNNQNNNLSNLQILCPNCHSQTPTSKGKKNKGKKYTRKQ